MIIDPQVIKSKSLEHDILCKAIAREKYASLGIVIQECGFFLSMSHPSIGATPDSLIGKFTVLEIKCPYNQRFSMIDESTIPFLLKDKNNTLIMDPTHPYYYQIQIQLFVTGRIHAKLIVYTFKDFKVIYVPRNDSFIETVVPKLDKFYQEYLNPLIVEKYLFKNYYKVFKKS